jgi:hypothetical protein
MTVATEDVLDRRMARQFLDLMFPDNGKSGFIAVSFKVPEEAVGRRADRRFNDYYVPRHCKPDNRYGWADAAFPSHQKDQLLDVVEERMRVDEVKVMISPALFARPDTRRLKDVAHVSVLHLDYDAPEGQEGLPQTLYAALKRCRAILVESGRKGNLHAYIPVQGLDLETHWRLSYALRDKFGADDKIRPNDLLTLPGTWNFKDPDQPSKVRLIPMDKGRPRPLSGEDEVIDRLGLASFMKNVPPFAGAVEVDPSRANLKRIGVRLLQRLNREARNGQGEDLSEANFRIIKMCKENRLRPEETFAFMQQLPDDLYKFADDESRLLEDIGRIWDKAGKREASATPPPTSFTRTTPVDEEDLQIDESDVVEDEPKQTFYRLGDLIAEVDAMPPPVYLVDQVIPRGDYGVISADSKAGKTFIMMDLALSVAAGMQWVDQFDVSEPGPVLIFVGEGGKRKIVRRVRAIARHKGIPDHQLLGLPIDISERAPKLLDEAVLEELRHKVAELRPILVIIDPLYLAASGANTASLVDMGSLLEKAQHIAQRVGASLVISHHTKKAAADTKNEEAPHLRTSGVGINEWGRFLIAIQVLTKKVVNHDTGESETITKWFLRGDEVADLEYHFAMNVHVEDRSDLMSPMHYAMGPQGEEEVLRKKDWRNDPAFGIMQKIMAELENHPGGVKQTVLLEECGLKAKPQPSAATRRALDQLEQLGCIKREIAKGRGGPTLITPTGKPLPDPDEEMKEKIGNMSFDFSDPDAPTPSGDNIGEYIDVDI